MTEFPERRIGKLTALVQAFTALGMMMGPIMGSCLYKLGGFKLPFFTTGALLLCLGIAVSIFVKTSQRQLIEEAQTSRNQKFSIWNVFKHFDIWTCAMCFTICLLCLSFKEPILAIELENFTSKVMVIGLVFCIDTVTFILTSIGL